MGYIHKGKPLYVTADRSEVVEEGDSRAAFLLVADGGSLSEEEAAKYGLGDAKKGGTPPPDNKAKAAPPNKAKG